MGLLSNWWSSVDYRGGETKVTSAKNMCCRRSEDTYDADVDFIAGGERGVAGYGHGMLQGEILHYVQTPQLLAHVFNGGALDASEEMSIKQPWREGNNGRFGRTGATLGTGASQLG